MTRPDAGNIQPEQNEANEHSEPATAFLAWRNRMNLRQRAAAAALGVTLTTYQSWEKEKRYSDGSPLQPPLTALLAAAALEHGLKPITGESEQT